MRTIDLQDYTVPEEPVRCRCVKWMPVQQAWTFADPDCRRCLGTGHELCTNICATPRCDGYAVQKDGCIDFCPYCYDHCTCGQKYVVLPGDDYRCPVCDARAIVTAFPGKFRVVPIEPDEAATSAA